MKVYCKNCAYYRKDNSGSVQRDFCFFGKKDNYDSTLVTVYRTKDKNSDGNCKDYKRQWWKFWVKEQAND